MNALYNSPVPRVVAHGRFLKLFPIMELLQLGYNVINYDADIALLRDPIPYFAYMKHDPPLDFVSTIESTNCKPDLPLSEKTEPNSGSMFIRASPQGEILLRAWILNIIKWNYFSDQAGFIFPKQVPFEGVNVCNPHATYNNSRSPDVLYPSQPIIRFSYLSKVLFQTGSVYIDCNEQDYMTAINQFGLNITLNPSTDAKKYVAKFPVSVHFNPRNKIRRAYIRASVEERMKFFQQDLWLLKSSDTSKIECSALDLVQTRWGRHMRVV